MVRQYLGRNCRDCRLRAAIEVGGSIGVLSSMLALLCEDLLGLDISEMPLREARERCCGMPRTRFEHMTTPQDWPKGIFDLIVLSEVLYFLSPKDIVAVTIKIPLCVEPGDGEPVNRPYLAFSSIPID